MIKLATDENFDGDILRGLLRRIPELDVRRVQDCGLAETPDPLILAWASGEKRVLVTHDRETMPNFAYDRVRTGQTMSGVFIVNNFMQKGQAVEEIVLALNCLSPEDCNDQVLYFPL